MKSIVTGLLCFSFLYSPSQSVLQAAWDFNGNAGNEVSVAPVTIAPHLQPILLSRGAGLTPAALANSFNSTGWTSTNSLTDAIANNDYLEWAIQPQSGFVTALHQLSVSFRRSGTGPDRFQWRYSVDGVNFLDLGLELLFSSTVTNGVAQLPIDLQSFTGLQVVSATQAVYFRLYGYNASAGSGSFALGRLTGNDLALTGSTQATTPQQLLGFSASRVLNGVQLSWEVAAEHMVAAYVIERAATPEGFQQIGTLPAQNSGWGYRYLFQDQQPLSSASFYRLKMMDIDGAYRYSPIIRMAAAGPTMRFRLVRVSERQYLIFLPSIHSGGIFSIYSAQGQLLQQWVVREQQMQLRIETGSANGWLVLRFQSRQDSYVDRLLLY